MGLLTNLANNLGNVGEKMFEYGLKRSAEEDLLDKKAAIDEQREKRIAEAKEASKAKWHDIEHGEKMADEVAKRTYEDDPNRLDNRYKAAQIKNLGNSGLLTQVQVKKAEFDLNEEKNPDSLFNQAKQAQINASNANVNQSNAATNKYNEEASALQQEKKLTSQYLTETDPEKRNNLLNDITVLRNKDPYALQESKMKAEQAQKIIDLTEKATDPSISQEERQKLLDEIQIRGGKKDSAGSMKVISVGTGEFIDGKEVTHNYLAQQDKKGNVNIVDPRSMIKTSFTDPDKANKKATELVDLELQAEKVTKPEVRSWMTTPLDQSRDGEFKALKDYENERNSRISQKTLELMGIDKTSGSGMLGGKVVSESEGDPASSKSSKNENFNVFNITSTKGGFEKYDSVNESVSELSDYIDRRATKGAVQGAKINEWLAQAGHPQDEKLGGKINSIERYFYAYAPPTENNTEAYVKNAVAMVNSQLPDDQKISRDAPIDITDPLIKRGLMLAIGAQEGETAWKTHNKEFVDAIHKETQGKTQQTASSGRQEWDLDKNGNPIRLR